LKRSLNCIAPRWACRPMATRMQYLANTIRGAGTIASATLVGVFALGVLSMPPQDCVSPSPFVTPEPVRFVPMEMPPRQAFHVFKRPARPASTTPTPARAQRPARRPDIRVKGEALCLASAIYFEARNQPRAGQIAVADVIMTRVSSPRWPGTVCGVVLQKAQFSFVQMGKLPRAHEHDAWASARLLALKIMAGEVELPMFGADHYHALKVHPQWAKHMTHIVTIGDHTFLKEGKRT